MPKPRRLAREIAVRSLYLMAANSGTSGHRAVSDVMCFAQEEDGEEFAKMVRSDATEMLLTIVDSFIRLRAEIDRDIAAFVDRDSADISAVEYATLAAAIAEFRSGLGTPPGVLISEYIEFSKVYGAEGAYRLVNGVLDSIVKDSAGNTGPDPGDGLPEGEAVAESEAIRRFFTFPQGDSVRVGIGDDAAVVDTKGISGLAVSTDTLVEGVHFRHGADPRLLGRKALAVGLSDLAAMGAAPLWATVALTHPAPPERWLAGFSEGLEEMASEHDVTIVGGDLARGPLDVTATVFGRAGRRVLRRSGLRSGDQVWMTGHAGEALLGLMLLEGRARLTDASASARAIARHQDPAPRIAVGLAIAACATAAIDVSDGLGKSLGLLAGESGKSIRVELDDLPMSPGLRGATGMDPVAVALGASDDYELLFGAPAGAAEEIARLAEEAGVPITRIGTVRKGEGVVLLRGGEDVTGEHGRAGHEHWA